MEGISKRQLLDKIAMREKERRFDEHIFPVNYDGAMKVDANFNYQEKGFWYRIKRFFQRVFIVNPYTFYQAKIYLRSKYVGRENLKGVKNAIVTCNHVNIMDCLALKLAVLPHRLYCTAAPFNNQEGFFGEMMRAGRMLPFSDNFAAMKNMDTAFKSFLSDNKSYVAFYPEQAMWFDYEKPRPFKIGAFHYAVKYNVPVVPIFITYKISKKLDAEGLPRKKYIFNIMPPIYPDNDLPKKERAEKMLNLNFESCKNKYEDFYKKPLTYDN